MRETNSGRRRFSTYPDDRAIHLDGGKTKSSVHKPEALALHYMNNKVAITHEVLNSLLRNQQVSITEEELNKLLNISYVEFKLPLSSNSYIAYSAGSFSCQLG